jgi:hypothetical protein
MAKTVLGSVAKIATKRVISDAAKTATAPVRRSNPIPAMAIGLATSFLSKRLLPVKIAGIGGVVIAAALTKLLLDRKDDGADDTAKSLGKLPHAAKGAAKSVAKKVVAKKPSVKRLPKSL